MTGSPAEKVALPALVAAVYTAKQLKQARLTFQKECDKQNKMCQN